MDPPPHFSPFEQRFLSKDNPILKVEDEFLMRHTKVFLTSDESERIWEVKLDGDELAEGWKQFVSDNKLKDGDLLVFRHDGDDYFHVSVSTQSNSIDLEADHASPSYVTIEDSSDDDYEVKKKKNEKQESGSSSRHTRFVKARVTPSSLHNDRLDFAKKFTVSFGEHSNANAIELVNEKGKRWTLIFGKSNSCDVFYMRRGWRNFCSINGLKQGDFCKFQLVVNGENPVLWLCSHESRKDHVEEEEECIEVHAVNTGGGGCSKEKSFVSKGKKKKTHSPFVSIVLTPNRYKNGQLYLSSRFIRGNGINKPRKITLLDKDGRKWSSDLHMVEDNRFRNEWFYVRKGWREMCEANGVKVNDSFVLEFIWEDANPMLKFHSKIENHESKGNENQTTRKKRACEADLQAKTARKSARVEAEGRTPVSIKPTATNSGNVQGTQPRSCSVSDLVSSVKESIVGTLNTLMQYRSELKIRERKLKASLLEIDALGESILGINHILNKKQI